MITTRIIWNGQGGELDSRTVEHSQDDDSAVRNALISMIADGVVNAGDTFVVEEVS